MQPRRNAAQPEGSRRQPGWREGHELAGMIDAEELRGDCCSIARGTLWLMEWCPATSDLTLAKLWGGTQLRRSCFSTAIPCSWLCRPAACRGGIVPRRAAYREAALSGMASTFDRAILHHFVHMSRS